jgi:integrase
VKKDGRARRDLRASSAVHTRRRRLVTSGLKTVCNEAGLPYRSPHKLRHGHAVYALKRARTLAELKAVSQNLMHSGLTIMDRVYGALTETDVQETIARPGGRRGADTDTLIAELEALLERAKRAQAGETE